MAPSDNENMRSQFWRKAAMADKPIGEVTQIRAEHSI